MPKSTLHSCESSVGPSRKVPLAAILPNRGGWLGAPSVRLLAVETDAEPEESLVADSRSGLTPSQCVDRRIASLLGAVQSWDPVAAGEQQCRTTSGSREGTGPIHRSFAAQAEAGPLPG